MGHKRYLGLAIAMAMAFAGCAGLANGARPSSDLPPDKQERENHYAADQAAGKANEHPRSEDGGPPTDDPNDVPVSGFPTKPAGDGTIVETGPSGPPGTDAFLWQNEWYLKTPNEVISVYAGSRKASPSQGVLFVTVWNADESQLVRSLVIDTPSRGGTIHFVAGKGKVAALLAADGTSLSFDASDLTVH